MDIEFPQALGKILRLPGLTDAILNGHTHTYADTGNGLRRIANPFGSAGEMLDLLVELGYQTGNRLDMAKPISDFSISGYRFHAVLPHGTSVKPLVSIRRHPQKQIRLQHLVETGMVSQQQREYLLEALIQRKNLVICGATSAGKTTLLSALIAELDERVICIEQIPELVIVEPAISLTERVANQEGLGAITMQQLVIEALRMRPDRIVVGEVRGSEFGVLLQAMNNGHSGSMTTIHSKSLEDLPDRFSMLGQLSNLSQELTKSLVRSSIQVVVQLQNINGKRTITQIGELIRETAEIVEVRP
ncbi:MAG: Flp pilus assembly complex ATPase component TadA [Actinomycetota bacterium]|jgi:pilus assembly protein CpaF